MRFSDPFFLHGDRSLQSLAPQSTIHDSTSLRPIRIFLFLQRVLLCSLRTAVVLGIPEPQNINKLLSMSLLFKSTEALFWLFTLVYWQFESSFSLHMISHLISILKKLLIKTLHQPRPISRFLSPVCDRLCVLILSPLTPVEPFRLQ